MPPLNYRDLINDAQLHSLHRGDAQLRLRPSPPLNSYLPSSLVVAKNFTTLPEKANYFDEPADVPSDAPPAYDDVNPPAGSSNRTPFTSRQRRTAVEKPRFSASNSISSSAYSQTSSPTRAGPSGPTGKAVSAVASPKVQSDVRETVIGLLRSVIHDFASRRLDLSQALGVLESCVGACTTHSLSLASILQERTIEGRSAVYWGIVSRSSGGGSSRGVDDTSRDMFLLEILSRAAPLSSIGVSELRSACLAVSDNQLFQRLRSIAGLVPLSGSDRMLAAGAGLCTPTDSDQSELERRASRFKGKEVAHAFDDLAQVYEEVTGQGKGETFKVVLQLRLFQRRMRISEAVISEFIARGRIWILAFFVVPRFSGPWTSPAGLPGSRTSIDVPTTIPEAVVYAARARRLVPGTWAVALGILEDSMKCYAQAQLVITAQSLSQDLIAPSDQPPNTKSSLVLNLTSPGSSLVALPPSDFASISDEHTGSRRKRERTTAMTQQRAPVTWEQQQALAQPSDRVLLVGIGGTDGTEANGRELMYDGCPYITSDGTLHATLETRLSVSPFGSRPTDCVIC